LGAPVPTPFYRWGPNLVCYSRPMVYVYLRNFVSIGYSVVLWRRKTPIFAGFAVFWTSAFSSAASWHAAVWESWARVHNYEPSPNQQYQNRFSTQTPSWRNRAHNLWRSKAWRTDRQTNKQKINVFGCPGGGWNSRPTKLGTVIEDLEHVLVLAPLKLLGHWKLWGNQTPST